MKEANWGLIIKAIKKVGKDKVYEALEKMHYASMNIQAELYADPETVKQAQKMQPMITRQEITLTRIKHFGEAVPER